jgi:hypothetical protein
VVLPATKGSLPEAQELAPYAKAAREEGKALWLWPVQEGFDAQAGWKVIDLGNQLGAEAILWPDAASLFQPTPHRRPGGARA